MRNVLTVEKIRVTVLSAEVDEAIAMSFSSLTDRRACIVEVYADGMVGIGESWVNYPGWAHEERAATLRRGVLPLVMGRDASEPRDVHEHLERNLNGIGRQWGAPGPIAQAISAIDIALWDLKGQALGVPVSHLLAGDTAPVATIPAYGSGVGPERVAELCDIAISQGMQAVKVKLGFGVEKDRATLREARDAIGGRVLLSDANRAWTLDEARYMLELLRDYDVAWLEEPLVDDGNQDLLALARETDMPLAIGENVYGLRAFEDHLASGAVGVIQPDITKCGGFTTAHQVALAAADRGVQFAPHCYGSAIGIAASLHLAAVCPTTRCMEMDVRSNPLRTALLTEPLRVVNGEVVVPTMPGLGVELDRDVVDRHCIDSWEVVA